MHRRTDAIVALAAAAAAAGAIAWPAIHHRVRPFDATIDMREPESRQHYTLVHEAQTWRLDDVVPEEWSGLHHGRIRPAGTTATFVADDGRAIRFRRITEDGLAAPD